MDDMLRVGVVTKPHGLKGEVKVYPTTSDPKRFKDLDVVCLVVNEKELPLHVETVKFFKNQVIVKFKEYGTIEEVEFLRNCDMMVSREDAIELKEGEYFLYDVIGCKVVDEQGESLGEVKEVYETGANPVFEVKLDAGKTVLFPVIDECILSVDIEQKIVKAHVMEGLMDI
ncbi:MAG: ribosome maturation factor RimM [Eubacterium sp.]|nr:ribosome maturation factor RimM [Eubacterium sp.]